MEDPVAFLIQFPCSSIGSMVVLYYITYRCLVGCALISCVLFNQKVYFELKVICQLHV